MLLRHGRLKKISLSRQRQLKIAVNSVVANATEEIVPAFRAFKGTAKFKISLRDEDLGSNDIIYFYEKAL